MTAKKTISHTSIYALGMILRNLASFIMLPIYTRFLTTEDYGVLELLSMLIDFVGIFLGLRLAQGIYKLYFDSDNNIYKGKIISNSMFIAVVLNGLGVFVIYLYSKPISVLVFGSAQFEQYVILFSLVLVLQSIHEIAMVYIKAQQRPWLYVGVSFLKLILVLTLNIYFVVIKEMHVEGVIYSSLIGGGIIGILLLGYTIYHAGISIDREIINRLTRFSFPLMLAGLGAFYLTFGDRYFLRIFHGLEIVGIYALGYKFGFMLLQFTWVPFQNIWDTQRYEIYHQRNDRNQIFQDTFTIISVLLILVALCIAVFVKDVLIIMSAPEFHAAYEVVPVILLAYIIQAWTGFSNFGIMLHEKTFQITYGAVAAVIVISLGYFLLIPRFGAMGAAGATVLGFFARLLWVNYQASKLYDMELPWLRVVTVLILATVAYSATLFAPENMVYSILFKAGVISLFILSLIVIPVLRKKDRSLVLTLVKNPLSVRRVFSKA